MKYYLITVDDYGLCEEVDTTIENLTKRDILSTTNVLMNFRTDFSNSPLKRMERLSIGIQL